MKKSLLTAITISALLFSLLASLNFARADITDADGGLITKQPYIISPTNTTYSLRFLSLNVSFHAPIYGNMNYSMTYSLDGSKNETMPLAVHYFGFFQQNKSYIDGLVSLPELSETSHNITIYLKLEMYNFINNQTYTKTYHDSQTAFFTIMGTASPSLTQQPTIEPTQTEKPTPFTDAFYVPNILPLIIGTIIVAIVTISSVIVYFKKHKTRHSQD